MNNYEKIKAMTLDEMAEFIKKEEELYNSDVDILDIKQWLHAESEG